jgi:hypothetical protein
LALRQISPQKGIASSRGFKMKLKLTDHVEAFGAFAPTSRESARKTPAKNGPVS